MQAPTTGIERLTGKLSEQPLLFQYTVKLVLLVAFLELILYRLVSRLGMHLSKLAADHQWIIPTFTALTEIGQWLLNAVAILLFLGLSVGLLNRLASRGFSGMNRLTVPCVSLLLLLTVGFLLVPPTMIGSAVYNTVALAAIWLLGTEFLFTHPERSHRILGVVYLLGISGWLYYQIVSTVYSFLGTVAAPPFVYEFHRGGEAFMVLASLLVYWAYGRGLSFRSHNQRQRRRAMWFWGSAGSVFLVMLFIDYILKRYDPVMAEHVKKGADGIGWIFMFGMGYSFYLPFAFYMAGLLAWAYTVIKLLKMGRLAGYGVGLMFIAGYALLYSNLTLMVVLGLMLLTLDRYKRNGTQPLMAPEASMLTPPDRLAGDHI